MNPFENIPVEDRLRDNPHSPHYGRYCLKFNQVLPFREPLHKRLKLKINNPESAWIYYNLLPEHLQRLIQFIGLEDEQGNFVYAEDHEYFLFFEMIGDYMHIAIENIYFAVLELAEMLEDCHFFIYSTGDDDNRWLDEYKIENGKLSFFHRNICNDHISTGRLDLYIVRAINNLNDYAFMRFVLYQLYDSLHFWTHNYKKAPHWAGNNLMDTVATIDMVLETNMPDKEKWYFIHFYSLDKDCPDWYSMNEKYKLREK